MIRTTTLDNGLQVVTEVMPDVRSVALSFWVGTGSRDETDAEWGMSHFLEHLLFKGSENRSALDIAQTIDAIGGDMNAFTTKECTAFYMRVLADDQAVALDILCDIMCEPAFDPEEIESERDVVLEEILMRNDEPGDLAHELLSGIMFDGHTLSREILGDESGIQAMTGDDIKRFFEHHYRPRNLVFAAAGRLDHDEIVREVERRWRAREGGERPTRVAPSITSGVRTVHRRPTDQAHLVLGVPAPSRHENKRYATSLMETILGGGMSSRLFQEVREKRGLAYTVYSCYTPYDDAGELSVYLGTAPKRVDDASNVVLEVFDDVKLHGFTEVELERAKRHLRATAALGLEDSGARMSRIGRSLLLHGNVLTVDEVAARLEAVTLEEVNAITVELLSVDPVSVVVGPVNSAESADSVERSTDAAE